ncbi:cytochrome c oxidase assembly protein PET191-domain-containing protein [Pterulicium gracile]|uniref:Cytochrome c oxidase assembly protein PET191-domain-containing protein n=1 Tax=Pterulicium gracile TaxID=1884261 RepID=A0A5C3QZN7_9AGAR|nr:cytochrome c oxidase assembly protein PET191-domain-containing protein [Pterula gracilis]
MSSSCTEILTSLKQCILHSDCVLKDGRLPSDCIRNNIEDLPTECQMLRKAHFDCKRGMLDMRKRMRGNNVGEQFASSTKKVVDNTNGGFDRPS